METINRLTGLKILCKAKTLATVSLHFENNEMTAVIKKSMLLNCKGTQQTGITHPYN